jgi:hypothetical protein
LLNLKHVDYPVVDPQLRDRESRWGAKTFIVKDPDGNLLLFAGPAE